MTITKYIADVTDRTQSLAMTESRLNSLNVGNLVRLALGESPLVPEYTFIGSRGSNDLRFARRKSSDTIVRVSLSPSRVSLCADGVYRGAFIEANIVKGQHINYPEYDGMLKRFNR